MPLKLINAGGSLTLSAVVLAALWTFRSARARHLRRSNAAANSTSAAVAKYACKLSPASLALLIELQAVPYYIIDVRSADECAAAPLPAWQHCVLQLPEAQLTAALTPPFTAWSTAAAAAAAAGEHLPPPSRHHLLVILGRDEQQQQSAASRAAAAGYNKVAVVADSCSQLQQERPAAAVLPVLHRDALALLLELSPLPEDAYQLSRSSSAGLVQQQQATGSFPNGTAVAAAAAGRGDGPSGDVAPAAAAVAAGSEASAAQRVLVLDVRRHDERTLYGAIPGALHVPVEELPSALALPAPQFKCRYHFDPPGRGDVLVLQSRVNSRAQWAAQLAWDAGWKRVFVYVNGVHSWNLNLAVQAYPSYQPWQSPPDPEPFIPCQTDVAAGTAELQRLGLLEVLLAQHAAQQ